MKVSTKGRYALRVMLDLAQHQNEGYISLKDVAARQELSMKYLEAIVAMLNKAGLLESSRGKKGGYKLNRPIREYSIGSILKLTEGNMAPVSCITEGHICCEKATECITIPMWYELDQIVDRYLESVSLEDLLNGDVKRTTS